MTLRARLMVLMLLATLVPALLLAARSVVDSRAEVRRAEAALAQAAANIVQSLNNRVQGTAQLHYGLALSGVLDDADRQACSNYLSAVREAYPQFTGIITVRPDGQLHCDSLRSGRTLDLKDRTYFKAAQQGATGLTLEPVFGRLTGQAVLQVVYPARHADQRLRFLLVASLNLQQFAETNRRQALHPESELVLLDHRGQVMAWTGTAADRPRPGTLLADSALLALARAHPAGGTGELTDAQGQIKVWAVAQAPAAGLHVLLGLPKNALVAGAHQSLRNDLLALAATAVLLFAGMWGLAERGIRRPVQRITGVLQAIGQGDLGVRVGQPQTRGELGSLMAALDSTAESLQAQRDKINDLGLRLRQAQKLEAIGTLAGGIAHDFNNIIGAILGNLQLVRQDLAAGRPAQPGLDQIQLAARRARELVQRIQTFSRADAPESRRQSLRRIVDDTLALVQVAMPPGAQLLTRLSPGHYAVWADAVQLQQVLMNLCTNASQALQGRAGQVTVGLDTAVLRDDDSLRPQGLEGGPHARLWVSDTGCGIAPELRERIFEPYFTTRVGQGGTGLGLSVVHGIVKAHHGAIVVDSRPGQGSTFEVYLPLLPDESADHDLPQALQVDRPEPEPTWRAPAAAAAPSAAPAGRRVCYVDDDPVMCLLVEALLGRAGYACRSHEDGDRALAALQADPQGCDLLITDQNMPRMSGLDLAAAVLRLRPDLPILMTTGHIAEELPAQARDCGIRKLIGKENLAEVLVPAVQQLLAGTTTPHLDAQRPDPAHQGG